ncbi:MAG: hypothetical protein RLZZ546_833, partial [Bacteroidota bacterium]
MHRIKVFFFWFFVLVSFTMKSQDISFRDISLDAAILEAKNTKKNIFIDTYSDWCIPCKKMDIEFRKPQLSRLLNENYINVKINLEHSPNAYAYKKRFEIVFLPTMLILDHYGNIRYKTDKFTEATELISIAEKAMGSDIFYLNDATEINNNPLQRLSDKTIENEKIIHQLGGSNANPEILMKEAYFRIGLMDGSHRHTAKKYLETQTNWGSKTNMKFILDFLYSVNTPEFEYLQTHLDAFKTEFGIEEVDRTLSIVINDELRYGFPRPDYNKVFSLYSLIDPHNTEKMTYEYFMERYLEEGDIAKYVNTAKIYIDKFNIQNSSIYYTIGSY